MSDTIRREPIRVLTVIDGLGFGGAEGLLAEFAAAAPAAGIELSVSYLREKDGSPAGQGLRKLGVEPALLPIGGLLAPSSFIAARRHIAHRAPDLVHTHLGYSDLIAGTASTTLGIPWVSTFHVMTWEPGLRNAVKLALFARARRHCASDVIAVSEAARRAYLARGWDRPTHVTTVHNGIAGQPRPGSGAAVRAELGLAPDDLVIGMLSVLRAGKGHDVAAAAVEDLRAEHRNVRLVVVGDGPSRPDIERLLAPLGDAARIVGHRADVMAVLDAVDVLIHPSVVDAFPTALLEAMAASVPVVATNIGGIPEIVEPGLTGLLIEAPPTRSSLSDALRYLLRDALARQEMGRAARDRFEQQFEAQAWARRIRSVYEDALAGSQRLRWR